MSRFRSVRIIVRLNTPGSVLACTNLHVLAMPRGSTVLSTVTPEHVSPASSHARRQSSTEPKVSRPGASTWLPTFSASGSCTWDFNVILNYTPGVWGLVLQGCGRINLMHTYSVLGYLLVEAHTW